MPYWWGRMTGSGLEPLVSKDGPIPLQRAGDPSQTWNPLLLGMGLSGSRLGTVISQVVVRTTSGLGHSPCPPGRQTCPGKGESRNDDLLQWGLHYSLWGLSLLLLGLPVTPQNRMAEPGSAAVRHLCS